MLEVAAACTVAVAAVRRDGLSSVPMKWLRRAAIVLATLSPWTVTSGCRKRTPPSEPGPAASSPDSAKPAPQLHGTPDDAKAMLPKVVDHVKSVGRTQAFQDFTARRPPFFYRDLYVVCVDAHQVVVAHGGFPTYVGSDSFFKDMDGKNMAAAIRKAAAKGDATVRYTLRDDETNNTVEHKIGFFRRINDDVCGVVAHEG
jgi:hypothetical protein